jgi:L-seryl-tRNA(Ser) seleniumtransferase
MTKMKRTKNRSLLSRRQVFRGGGLAAAGLMAGAAPAAASAARGQPAAPDVYTRVGVRPFINLTAAVTINGGLLTKPDVKKAMEEASYFSVNIDELMEGVGKRLAEIMQCEAAIVTSGCAAALTHATSACLAGGDPERIQQLPDLTGLKTEVIMPRASRNTYDHAIRALGIKMITVDTPQELRSAINRNTAMVAFLGSNEKSGKIRFEELVATAHQRKVPVLVDASAEWPLVPDPYLARGADLVGYSGGKIYAGPQCSGFLFGRKDLVQAAWVNGAPHHAFGRMMKVGKEEIMGALAAVEYMFSERNYQRELDTWNGWLSRIEQRVKQVPGVSTKIAEPPGKNPHPVLTLSWDPKKIGFTAGELHDTLTAGEPRIQTHASGEGHSFQLRVGNCRPEQIDIVAQRLEEVFRAAPPARKKGVRAPVTDLSGRWDVELSFVSGSSEHLMFIEADGNTLAGTHQGRRGRGELAGKINGDEVRFRSSLRTEGERSSYGFSGRVNGDSMSGDVDLGEYATATAGPPGALPRSRAR